MKICMDGNESFRKLHEFLKDESKINIFGAIHPSAPELWHVLLVSYSDFMIMSAVDKRIIMFVYGELDATDDESVVLDKLSTWSKRTAMLYTLGGEEVFASIIPVKLPEIPDHIYKEIMAAKPDLPDSGVDVVDIRLN